MKYYKVKRGTDAWVLFDELWRHQDKWYASKDRIEALIECSMQNNLAIYTRCLALAHPPDHLASQFKANAERGNYFHAKKTSPINKAWLALVGELGLTAITWAEVIFSLGFFPGDADGPRTAHPPMNGEYYFSTESDGRVRIRSGESLADKDWAEPISEPNFLRLQADWIESRQKEDTHESLAPAAEGT